MPTVLTPSQIEQVLGLLQDHSGLRIPSYRHGELARAVHTLAQEHTQGDVDMLLHRLASPAGAEWLQELVEALTVGESYFFRDKGHFAILEQEILPEIRQRRQGQRIIRIWSAACASGEEPYSLAILLHQMGMERQGWRYQIVGTDVDRQALARARQAVYRPWSLRQTPASIRDTYFEEEAGAYRLRPPVRDQVAFQHLNLVSGTYPDWGRGLADFDLILCRNVLIYFEPEMARRVVARLYRCLAPGGWLLVSAVEAMAPYYTRFQAVRLHGITVYRRPLAAETGDVASPAASIPLHQPALCQTKAGQPDVLPSGDPMPGADRTSIQETPRRDKEPPKEEPTSPQRPGDAAVQELLEAWYDRHDPSALAELAGWSPQRVDDPNLACDVARMYASRGEWPQALAWLERAKVLAPDLARVHYWLGVVAYNQNDLPAALDGLRRAIYLAPDKVLAHLALAAVWRELGDPERATRALDNASRHLRGWALDASVDPEDEPGLTVRDAREMIRLQREVG